jgi:hypothetical protein
MHWQVVIGAPASRPRAKAMSFMNPARPPAGCRIIAVAFGGLCAEATTPFTMIVPLSGLRVPIDLAVRRNRGFGYRPPSSGLEVETDQTTTLVAGALEAGRPLRV